MLSILDKPLEKEFSIIKILDSADRYWTGAEIAQKIGISANTVRKYINSLASHLAFWPKELIAIDISSNLGNRLYRAKNFHIDTVYTKLAEASLTYQFFAAMFADEQETMLDFCLKHYISVASLYRKLSKIRQELTDFNLELDVASLKLVGSEVQIRYFYYNFFHQVFRGHDWPFMVSREHLKKLSDSICQMFAVTISKPEEAEFLIWLAVSSHRQANGYYVVHDFSYLTEGNYAYSEFRQLLRKKGDSSSLVFVEKECEWLFALLHAFPFFTNLHEALFCSAAKKSGPACYPLQASRLFVKKFLQEFSLQDNKKLTEFTAKLNRLHIHASLFHGSSDMPEYYTFLAEFDDLYPDFASRFYSFYHELKKMAAEPWFADAEYLVPHYVLLFSQYMRLSLYEAPISIRLCTDYGPIYEERLKNEIITRLYYKFSINFVAEGEKCDLKLSNIPAVDAGGSVVISIHDAFNQREWDNFNQELKKIRLLKAGKRYGET